MNMNMMMDEEREHTLVVHKIRAGTIFKLLFLCLVSPLLPFGFLFGIEGYFGADTLVYAKQPIHGVAALFAGPAMSIAFAGLLTLGIGIVAVPGLRLFLSIWPITIKVVSRR